MTVKELILILSDFDVNKEVKIAYELCTKKELVAIREEGDTVYLCEENTEFNLDEEYDD